MAAATTSNLGGEALMEMAEQARALAYAPYSNYTVGAALVTVSGDVFLGCNVENASYGLTVCAERVAIFKAVSEGNRRFRTLAIASSSQRGTGPCGACRQVLQEFSDNLVIFVRDAEAGLVEVNLDELLPRAFGPRNLARDRA